MKKILIILLGLFFYISCGNEQTQFNEQDAKAIKKALNKSAEEWSKGNLEGYMDVYWKSDKLQFISVNGIAYGWQETFDKYKAKYPTQNETGKLALNILSIEFLAENLYSVSGEYHLERVVGNVNGIFTLIFKKINSARIHSRKI
jgi:hypothetical protein